MAILKEMTHIREPDPVWKLDLRDQEDVLWRGLRTWGAEPRSHLSDRATYVLADSLDWLEAMPAESIHAIVTDPPYGVIEYNATNHAKLRDRTELGVIGGGVWRRPPAFDGANRQPLPRFTVLTSRDRMDLHRFFSRLAEGMLRALVPGGHVLLASNPLLSTETFHAIEMGGLEKRGEIIRTVQTLRGGDRPKGAEAEFPDVSVMPRSCWEPWGLFRKPFQGTVAANLRRWGTGGLRRPSTDDVLKDLVPCSTTRGAEKTIAPHPSLKPQRLLRQLVRASLPLGIGIVYDPFAGSGSTLAAAAAVGYTALGSDHDDLYFGMAKTAFGPLSELAVAAR